MKNEEIGTYQIAEAIRIEPKLRVLQDGGRWKALINGVIYTANIKVLTKTIDCKNVIKLKKLKNNEIIQLQTAYELLENNYGVEYDEDWELIYNPEEVWLECQKKSTKNEKVTDSPFCLEEGVAEIL